MKGWKRLWVFLTVIWAVIVIGYTVYGICDTWVDAEGPWIISQLSDDSKPFFEEFEFGQNDLIYPVAIQPTDGEAFSIEFPVLDEEGLDKMAARIEIDIREMATKEGMNIEEAEVHRFIEAVRERNRAAKSALKEYEELVKKERRIQISRVREKIGISILYLFGPPLIIILLTVGALWVREGFR